MMEIGRVPRSKKDYVIIRMESSIQYSISKALGYSVEQSVIITDKKN